MGKRDKEFWRSAIKNNATFDKYYNRLVELAISTFKWKNLPDTVNERFLELILFSNGSAVFFKEPTLGYLGLRMAWNGRLNIYREPTKRRAYADNGFNMQLDENNSVIIWNNFLHTNSMQEVVSYALMLADLECAIDVNAKAQKTPILLACDEDQRLTLQNLYMKYDGNQPFICGEKSIKPDSIKAINTQAPYVADRLYMLKTEIWNEALTFLGIPNVNISKKERLITDEVDRLQGGTLASRQSRLKMRQTAAEQINKMFGLELEVEFESEGGIEELNVPEENVKVSDIVRA